MVLIELGSSHGKSQQESIYQSLRKFTGLEGRNTVKILLIDPPFYRFIGYYNRYFPLGLAYLAAVLRENWHEVLIYDADCNVNPSKMDFTRLEDSYPFYLKSLKDNNHPIWQEMKKTIHNFKPDIIGISVWTTFAASAFKIASICKEYDRNSPVVMGGPLPTRTDAVAAGVRPLPCKSHRVEGEKTFV